MSACPKIGGHGSESQTENLTVELASGLKKLEGVGTSGARMAHLANGAALVDGSGEMIGADEGFLCELGLPRTDFAAAWRKKLREAQNLVSANGAVTTGDLRMRFSGPRGTVDVEPVATPVGTLLVARSEMLTALVEHALRSDALTRVASGVAHDIRNPLNAMVLQIALLGEKIASGDSASASAHLATLRDQVSRVNDVLRRLGDVTEPSAPPGVDLQRIATDTASLLGHEARRRHVTLTLSPGPKTARTSASPERVGRLVLALMGLVVAQTPEGATLTTAVSLEGDDVLLSLTRPGALAEGGDGGAGAVLVDSLGPSLTQVSSEGRVTVKLRLPAEVHG